MEIYCTLYWLCGKRWLTEHRNAQWGHKTGVRIILFKENYFDIISTSSEDMKSNMKENFKNTMTATKLKEKREELCSEPC